MRKVSLLLALSVAGLTSFGQLNKALIQENDAECKRTSAEPNKSYVAPATRAGGDVIWSYDFTTNPASSGFTMTDNAGIGGWLWIDQDTAFTGDYTPAVDAMISSSPNGYMHLPADYYNCVPGVWPRTMVASPVNIDATLQTPAITLSGTTGVVLKFKTWFRLCCSSTGTKLDVNVSADGGSTWTTLNGRIVNGEAVATAINAYPNGDQVAEFVYNISSIVGNSTSLMVQFRMQGGSHYFWSIDDISVEEPLGNDVQLSDRYAGNFSIYTTSETYSDGSPGVFSAYNTNYSEVPSNIVNPLHLGAYLHQAGGSGTNARVNFVMTKEGTAYYSGTSTSTIANYTALTGDTIMYTDTAGYAQYVSGTFADVTAPAAQPVLFNSALTLADFQTGSYMTDGIPYEITYTAVTDNTDDVPTNNFTTYPYAQTQGRYSYHWQPTVNADVTPTGIFGSYNYVVDEAPGDFMGNVFELISTSTQDLKIYGIRVFIPNTTSIVFDGSGNGATFYPDVMAYDATPDDYISLHNDGVLTAQPYTLTAADKGTWVYLPFTEEDVDAYTFEHGTYYVGLYFESYVGEDDYYLALDNSVRQGYGHFIGKVEGSLSRFGVTGSVMIDAYTSKEQMQYDMDLSSGVTPVVSNNAVKVYPNPTSGLVKIDNVEGATINVYNVAGALVQTVVSNSVNTSLNLSGLSNGSYIVKIVKNNEVVTKKVNLNK